MLALYFLFNVGLHLVYGVDEPHLYGAHYVFALIGMLALPLTELDLDSHPARGELELLRYLAYGVTALVAFNNLSFVYGILGAEK